MLQYLRGENFESLPSTTCLGAMINYIALSCPKDFQPMNANYGIIKCEKEFENKQEKRKYMLDNSLEQIKKFKENTYGKSI